MPIRKTQLRYRVDGLPEDQGHVRLGVFRERLDTLYAVLLEAEREAAGKRKASADFLVTNLTHSSPAEATIEPSLQSADLSGVSAIELLREVVDSVFVGGPVRKVSSRFIRGLVDLCGGANRNFRSQHLHIGDASYALDDALAAKFQSLLEKKYTVFGEIKGKIERLNVHDRREFFIYPTLGASSTRCHFQEELRHDVARAIELGLPVIAHGHLTFYENDFEPAEALIEQIELPPEGYEVPKLESILGKAKNMTNGEDSHTFIRKIRDGWERH